MKEKTKLLVKTNVNLINLKKLILRKQSNLTEHNKESLIPSIQ